MPIGHLHRPSVLMAVTMAAVLLLRDDASATLPSQTVVFVGKVEESDDPSYASFRAALDRRWPADRPKPRLAYLAGGESSSPEMLAALRTATARRPQVLVLPTGGQAQAAMSLNLDVPIVFATFVDPRKDGIVASLRRPGGQITGVMLEDSLDLKRLELLKAALPHVNDVAVLADEAWFSVHGGTVMSNDAQRRLGLLLTERKIDTPEALDALMESSGAKAHHAWLVPPSYLAYQAETKIIAALKRLQRPSIHGSDEEVERGALMAYSQDDKFAYDALAELTRRVALGEDAGTIPIQRPYRYTLSVRIEPDAPWAQIDPSVVRRADRVVRP